MFTVYQTTENCRAQHVLYVQEIRSDFGQPLRRWIKSNTALQPAVYWQRDVVGRVQISRLSHSSLPLWQCCINRMQQRLVKLATSITSTDSVFTSEWLLGRPKRTSEGCKIADELLFLPDLGRSGRQSNVYQRSGHSHNQKVAYVTNLDDLE